MEAVQFNKISDRSRIFLIYGLLGNPDGNQSSLSTKEMPLNKQTNEMKKTHSLIRK